MGLYCTVYVRTISYHCDQSKGKILLSRATHSIQVQCPGKYSQCGTPEFTHRYNYINKVGVSSVLTNVRPGVFAPDWLTQRMGLVLPSINL